jgi:hypothetical protein
MVFWAYIRRHGTNDHYDPNELVRILLQEDAETTETTAR